MGTSEDQRKREFIAEIALELSKPLDEILRLSRELGEPMVIPMKETPMMYRTCQCGDPDCEEWGFYDVERVQEVLH